MNNRLFIGIAGGSGSGKTTLARRLEEYFGEHLSLLRHDDYYKSRSDLSLDERATLKYDHPDAFDNALLVSHMDELRAGHDVASPT